MPAIAALSLPDGVTDAHALIDVLRSRLATGDLSDGDRVLPEREIAALLGVSRRALRQALDVLEAEGRIWRRQGQGTFLGAPPPPRGRSLSGLANHTSPLEIMEVRMEIEPILARLAALRATPAELDIMMRLAERCRDAPDETEYERWDSAFHRKIAEAAHNGLVLALFDSVRALRRDPDWIRLREMRRQAGIRRQLGEGHCAIVAALTNRDPDAAEAAMREHLQTVTRTMTSVLNLIR